ncbi:DUF460 domain-containing protein [Halococcoides cellulosivorans]|uniref:DUF460 domain-containing protein n=1 Tax=Halococcoides cellulosivorans TaxID=1679096 RepID=A0A2R4X483_9EURY|nr:DUF460 domain-containing protein [Halococcoides cellulosivorans]AWB28611.1 DUF460 domain-containing protein [Halococcoides cellulosivorans]
MSDRTRALDETVFGVDVQSGDVRGDAPQYALAELDDDLVRATVSRRQLFGRIEAAEPAIVATDNVYELAEDRDALIDLLRGLPAGTRLVQVTGGPDPEPLSRVANRHDVPYDRDPMAEATASAHLAAAGVGTVVSAFTDRTRVKVSRGRSPGKGGSSEDRYTRRIHGSVKRRAREVGETLDEAGLEYDREVTEKYGGFANAVFTVAATPAEIPVTTGRSGDVRVTIERERGDGISFEPLTQRRDHVVVGIDPGTTTAIALVDLDGHLLEVTSTRSIDRGGVVEWIVERGRPVLVAADVTPMPETVEKIRRSVEAAGWTPTSDLPVDEKAHRTREHPVENDHERDALAAALFAIDDHRDQFDRIAAKVPADVDRGTVIRRVLTEETSVEVVLADLDSDPNDGETGTRGAEYETRRRADELAERVAELEAYVADLERELADRDATIEEYEQKLRDARSAERSDLRERREVSRLEREIDRLERELDDERERVESLEGKLERLKALWKLDHDDFADVDRKASAELTPVKVVEKFTEAAIRDADERFGVVEGDVVLFRDATGAGTSTARLLADIGPRLVLRTGGLSDQSDRVLFEEGVPVAPAEAVTVQEVDELAVARESDVEAAIDEWESYADERRREQNAAMVERLISEHRASGSDG